MTEGRRIVRAMIVVSSASLLSVVLGFGVQVTLAAFYGASRTMDAYFVAIALPILLSSVAHSVLIYTLVPILKTRVVAGNSKDFWGLASAVFAAVGGMALVSVVGLILFAEGIIALLAPGLDAATRRLAIDAFRIIVVGLVFDSLRAVLETVYLARERFFLPQFVPALFYFVMLACIMLFAPSLGISGVALGWLMGFALIFVLLCLPLAREYRKVHPRTFVYRRDIPWRALAVGAAAVALFQSAPLIDRAIASGLPAGSISYLGYGGKVLDILMRIVPMALGLAIFPHASEYAARNEILKLRMQVRRYIRTAVLIALPIAIAVVILRVPVITLFFERGAFDAAATNQVTNVIVWYMVAFVPMSVLTILTYTFYSLRRLGTVVTLGLLNVTLTLVGDVLFSQWWGYVGIAISNVCVATVLVTVAWLVLERGNETATKPAARAIDGAWLGNLALGAGIMALGMYSLQSFAFPGFPRGGVLLADLTSVSSVGALLYIGTMLLQRNPELLALVGHVAGWVAVKKDAELFARKESHVAIENSD